jgi:hypothetical protein
MPAWIFLQMSLSASRQFTDHREHGHIAAHISQRSASRG